MEVAGQTVLAQPATLEVVVMCSSFLLDAFGSKPLFDYFSQVHQRCDLWSIDIPFSIC